jgi:hypothetical protein
MLTPPPLALLLPLALMSPLEQAISTQRTSLPSETLAPSGDRSSISPVPPRFAKKKTQEQNLRVVKVMDAAIASENIAGSWYYTLGGSVTNNSVAPVRNVVVYYEISAPGIGKIVDAGSSLVQPMVLKPGDRGEFKLSPKMGGQVKITLIEWLNPDRSYGSYSQMQVFP